MIVDVTQACQLMKQALEILDATGAHQSAGMLDLAIHALPGMDHIGDAYDAIDAALFLNDATTMAS